MVVLIELIQGHDAEDQPIMIKIVHPASLEEAPIYDKCPKGISQPNDAGKATGTGMVVLDVVCVGQCHSISVPPLEIWNDLSLGIPKGIRVNRVRVFLSELE